MGATTLTMHGRDKCYAGVRFSCCPWLSCRRWRTTDHRIITALIFLCTFCAFWERMGFTIAFTVIAEEMGLTETEKGMVFSSYYYGFAATQIPGGYFAGRCGGKIILAVSFLLVGPASALTALASASPDYIVSAVVACRLAVGIAQGFFLPAAHSVLAHWVPPAHRGAHFAMAMSGMFAGAAIAMGTVPILALRAGPRTIFYISAALSVAWVVLWAILGSDMPSNPKDMPVDDFAGILSRDSTSEKKISTTGEGQRGDASANTGGRPAVDVWEAAGIVVGSQAEVYEFRNAWPAFLRSKKTTATDNNGGGIGGDLSDRSCTTTAVAPPALPEDDGSCTNASALDKDREGCDSPRIRARLDSSGLEAGGDIKCGCRKGEAKKHTKGECSTTAPATPEAGTVTDEASPTFNEQDGYNGDTSCGGRADGRNFGHPRTRGPLESLAAPAAPFPSIEAAGAQHPAGGNGVAAGASQAFPSGPHRTAVRSSSDGGFSGDGAAEKFASARRPALGPFPSSSAAGTRISLEGSSSRSVYGRSSSFDSSLVSSIIGNSRSSSAGRPVVSEVGPSAERSRNHFRGIVRLPESEAERPPSAQRARESSCSRQEPGSIQRSCESSRQGPEDAAGVEGAGALEHPPFPWRDVGKSPAAWAVVAGNVGAGTPINVIMSWLPTYFEGLIEVDLAHIGLWAQLLPYLAMMAFSIVGGVAYCWLITSLGISVATASKVVTGTGFSLTLCTLLCMGLARSPVAAALLSSLALATAALSRGGWSTNHVEICAPEHASMLYSVSNFISAAMSVVGLSVTGKVLDRCGGSTDPGAWTAAMGSIGAFCGACGLYFVVFARGNKVLFPRSAAAAAEGPREVDGELFPAPVAGAQDAWPRPFGMSRDMLWQSGRQANILSTAFRPNIFVRGSRRMIDTSSGVGLGTHLNSLALVTYRKNVPTAGKSRTPASSLLSSSAQQFEFYGAGGAM